MTGALYRAAGERFALIGHPVAHSVSPAMMRAAFDALGLPHAYEAIDGDVRTLERCVAELRAGALGGLNVTVPHKRAALALSDLAGEEAARAGAANVLVRQADGRIRAENTDAPAIVRVLSQRLTARRWALILGSGGAARAALLACEALGFRGVEITSRSWTSPEEAWERSADLPEIRANVQPRAWGESPHEMPRSLRSGPRGVGTPTAPPAWEGPQRPLGSGACRPEMGKPPWVSEWGERGCLAGREADLIVQATSAGMEGADPGDEVTDRVPWDALSPEAVAFDVIYRPRSTPFLEAARRRGLHAEDGLGMLVEQAALALNMWLGRSPPRSRARPSGDGATAPAVEIESGAAALREVMRRAAENALLT